MVRDLRADLRADDPASFLTQPHADVFFSAIHSAVLFGVNHFAGLFMQLEEAVILSNATYREDYRLLLLRAPGAAAAARPGQFAHLRIPARADLSLRRPFSLFKAEGDTLSILYKVVGEGTSALASLPPGGALSLLGPLGNGFPTPCADRLPLLIGGGYGLAALYLTAARSPVRGIVFAGAQTARGILCEDDFTALGWTFITATDDGSAGRRGRVTDALDAWLAEHPGTPTEWFACGPQPMLRALGDRAAAAHVPAWISLDHHMACGVGACLACVQWVLRDGHPALLQTCREGPVFAASDILWDYHP